MLQKRLDYSFNGYQVPATPRATRSARRSSFKKRSDDNQMRAFDLLATVAGKLLLDKESLPTCSKTSLTEDHCVGAKNTVKNQCQNEHKSFNVEASDQGDCNRRFFHSGLTSQVRDETISSRKSLSPQNNSHLGNTSVVTTCDYSESFVAQKLLNGKGNNGMGSFASKVDIGSFGCRKSNDCKVESNNDLIIDKPPKTGKAPIGIGADMCSIEDPVVWDGKPPALVSSDSSAKALLYSDHLPRGSFPIGRDDVNLVSNDDDENSSVCTLPSTRKKFFRPAPRIGDRRIRKILASKYWKGAPKLKDVTLSNKDADFENVYHSRKNCYKHQRSQRNFPIKKRKFYECSSELNSDEGISSEGISGSPERGMKGDAYSCCPKMHGASGVSSSVAGQQKILQSRDAHVKLRIKSFRVPELFIEIPETATVGSLKRTVMEAVTAILGGGLRVGVLLQGKKVRDDNKTLLQTGISHENKLDALGFSLEPNPSQTSPPLCSGDAPYMLSCDTPQPLTRYPLVPSSLHQDTSEAVPETHASNIGNFIESDHDSAPSPTDMSIDKGTTESKALVTVPASMSVEALAVVPAHRKLKRSEIVQRRIRRPFSVAEVEALVQAVEKLGTGRWRDVKLRAFDNAKHRTYVDLKDKWKTLVHTARISPQQRRGEPVPQELLERVLAAHAYWSQQQAKQQLKQQPESCLLL
ncbi:hypothetical protein CFOL_v3_21746 [Cephalotus follicularis]|uniref:Myb_DNA-binding domain-containing protein n=1 Tax=Cephalotus follicularis TaxID=3775 RepID=A0A1Q3CDT2_CEPFO|nr:hypothetical protein CFOL_v3_21746 [Cephalotus follicularis]